MLSRITKNIDSRKIVCFSALEVMVSLGLRAYCGGILASFLWLLPWQGTGNRKIDLFLLAKSGDAWFISLKVFKSSSEAAQHEATLVQMQILQYN